MERSCERSMSTSKVPGMGVSFIVIGCCCVPSVGISVAFGVSTWIGSPLISPPPITPFSPDPSRIVYLNSLGGVRDRALRSRAALLVDSSSSSERFSVPRFPSGSWPRLLWVPFRPGCGVPSAMYRYSSICLKSALNSPTALLIPPDTMLSMVASSVVSPL